MCRTQPGRTPRRADGFLTTVGCPTLAGLVGIVPALGMMTAAQNPPNGPVTFGPGQLLAWSLSLAFFGVFIAVPLRSQTIIKVRGGSKTPRQPGCCSTQHA